MICTVCSHVMTSTSIIKKVEMQNYRKIDYTCVNCGAQHRVTEETISGATKKHFQNFSKEKPAQGGAI